MTTPGVIQRFAPLFEPQSIALVGASNARGKWGFTILLNLLHGGFKGKVFPVNIREKEVLGLPASPSVKEISGSIDLAVIVVPRQHVQKVIEDCVEKGVKAGIVITIGYSEVGDGERELENQMVKAARAGGMILVGPNCMGVTSTTPQPMHCTMGQVWPDSGPVAMVSQSGNAATSMMNMCRRRGIGVSRVISSGNEADLQTADYIEYLGADPQTKVIMSYLEGVTDGKRLTEVAKAVSREKPIIMLKAGRTTPGARAAKSHTGALSGSDEVFDVACRQTGIIRVNDLVEMLDVALAFMGQPLPRGKRVGIVTAGGGWGVLATDACCRAGLEIATLPKETMTQLEAIMPPNWSRNNPVDLVAGGTRQTPYESLRVLLECEEVDGAIALGLSFGGGVGRTLKDSPYAKLFGVDEMVEERMKGNVRNAQFLLDTINTCRKPIMVATQGTERSLADENEATALLRKNGVFIYPTPERAAGAFAKVAEYASYLLVTIDR